MNTTCRFRWYAVIVVAIGLSVFSFPAFAVTSQPTRLVIPAIELDETIMPVGFDTFELEGQLYGQWAVLAEDVGWHNLSASLGVAGNTVLNGHSNLEEKVFQPLPLVEVGTVIEVYAADNTRHDYVVTTKVLLQEEGVSLEQRRQNAQWIAPTMDERLTLITCVNGSTQRLIVVAYPVRQPFDDGLTAMTVLPSFPQYLSTPDAEYSGDSF